MNKSKLLGVFLVISFTFNFLFLFFLFKTQGDVLQVNNFEKLRERYPLIATRVLQEFPQDLLINFLTLRQELTQQTKPYGEHFGLYFEYLPTGTSIGINSTNQFHAASLFKLPVIMAYLRGKESTKDNNDEQLTITHKDIDKQFGNLWRKGEGYNIKSSDAIKIALQESDNTAAKLIADKVQEKDFNAVYQGLDIALDSDKNGAILTARSYSSILKALYFAAVINKDDSEKLLDILTKTKFPDKLAAGVPTDVMVAHKIGDFHDISGKNEAFTDCGIVYVPRRPYLLCMVSFSDENTARQRMSRISKTIYDYVSSVDN